MANFLSEAMTSSQTSLKLNATSEFPQSGIAQIESEKVHFTKSTDQSLLHLTRAYSSTSAATHAAGKAVTLVSTDVTVNSFSGQQLANLADPTNAQDAATKAYVDASLVIAEAYVDSKISVLAADPGSPTEGQVWYNTTTHLLKFYDGTDVKVVATV